MDPSSYLVDDFYEFPSDVSLLDIVLSLSITIGIFGAIFLVVMMYRNLANSNPYNLRTRITRV